MSYMTSFQFASRISSLRKEAGITQEQVAQYVGVSKAAVSKWETGLSYPDITLLPKLATFFNLSIDSLLGYEPQMTEENIRKLYNQLAQKFSTSPFSEVQEEIEDYVKEYYSCFPLLLEIAVLYLNYHNQSKQPGELLNRVLELCERVRSQAQDYKYVYKAEVVESTALLMMGEAEKVLELLGDDVEVQFGTDNIIATAHTMLARPEKARETLQISIYQHVMGLLASATDSLMLEVDNSEHYDETVKRMEILINHFNIEKINVNCALVFYIKAAYGYMMQQRPDDAMQMLKHYGRLCSSLTFPIYLKGDSYFDLLENWMKKELAIAEFTPRDEASIKKDILAGVMDQPLLAPLHDRPDFKALILNLKHHLNLS
ncbi:helix-turn-helix transcriptional regulator [Lysinibacillus sp. BW-2-10]|nr:helix-turn-helix transcriptional regulator [Lysinibacillus sp. BW-2-10]